MKTLGINIPVIVLFFLFICICTKSLQGTTVQNISSSNDTVASHVSPPVNPFQLVFEVAISGDGAVNYLQPVYLLRKHKQDYIENLWDWLQAYATYLSFLTSENQNTLEVTRQWLSRTHMRDTIATMEHVRLTNDDALSYLIQRTKNEQVVMLNENHFLLHHRILAEMLLDSLYVHGFRYFAVEAISQTDTLLNERKFAVTQTGFYTREPMMANLIRSAIKRGFYVFGYDAFSADRARDQMLNIKQNVFEKNPLAKVFMLVGFSHNDETVGNPRRWLARELYYQTGINPLTINQTVFSTKKDNYFLMILDTVIIQNRRPTNDIFIVNNISYDFLADINNFENHTISIPEHIIEQVKNEPLMFVASFFIADEFRKDHTAIPVYNHLLKSDEQEITIRLPRDNDYLFTIRDRQGNIVLIEYLSH